MTEYEKVRRVIPLLVSDALNGMKKRAQAPFDVQFGSCDRHFFTVRPPAKNNLGDSPNVCKDVTMRQANGSVPRKQVLI